MIFQRLTLLALLFSTSTALHGEEGADATVRQHLSLPQPQAIASAPSGGTVILSSDGTKTSLIGRIGWVGANWNLGLSLEAPIEKPEDEATLADVDGLAGATVATVNLARTIHVSAPLSPLDPCTEFNKLAMASRRQSLGLENHAQPMLNEMCTLESIEATGKFGANALRASRERALQATCNELSKLGVMRPTASDREVMIAAAEQEPIPSYLPESCGAQDSEGAARVIAHLEEITARFRPPAPGEKSQAAKEQEALGQQVAAIERVDASARTPGQRREFAVAKQRLDLLKKQVDSGAVQDPRSWFELEHRKLLAETCAAADQIPIDKLIDVTEQNAPDKGCELGPLQKAVASSSLARADKARLALDAQRSLLPTVWLVSGAASAGNQTFKYRKSGTLEPTSEAKVNKSLTGTITRASGIDSWNAGYSWHESYKGGKKVLLCEPVSGTASEVCGDAVLTAPKRNEEDRSLFFVEYRRFLAVQLALGARAFYRDELEQWGIRSTWYFLVKDKIGLDGGIEIGWDREVKALDASGKPDEVGGLIARLFVGRRFELFGAGS